MKTSLLVKFALAGAVLASAIPAASAAARHHMPSNTYGYGQTSNTVDYQITDDEQRTRDLEANQNG